MTAVIEEYFSPKSGTGAIGWSVFVHGLIWGAAILILNFHFVHTEPKSDYVDLGYEVFDAPPQPATQVHRIRSSATPVTQPVAQTIPDNSPKELHDDKSEVAGTQKAAKETNIGSTANGDANATPYYKIRPKYPKAALIEGIEGWVLFQIDINEQGGVENIRVIGGEQRNMFEAEARRALEQWKYRPFLDAAGKPFMKHDHQVRVDFKLSDAEVAGG